MLTITCVVLLGLLAGEELIIKYGVQPALATLPDDAHVRARIALVKRMKVVVPALILPAVAATVAHLATADNDPLRWVGLAALVAFLLFSAFGTVPINMQVDGWDPAAPPPGWRALAERWARIDLYRSSAAVLAFVLFTVAAL